MNSDILNISPTTGRTGCASGRRGRGTGRGRVFLALLAFSGAGLIAGCGGSSGGSTTTVHLNTPHVARAIEGSILAERHIRAAVTCPAVVVQKQGNNFVCVATTRDSKGVTHRTTFAVTQQNGKGYVTYHAE